MGRLTPSYRSSTTTANSGANLAVTAPSGLADGDYILVGVHVNDGAINDIASVPSGWATIVTKKDYGSGHLTVFGKTANGEGSSWTWTMNNNNSSHGMAVAVQNADTVSPVDASGGQTNASSTNIVAPSISPTISNDLLVAFFVADSGASAVTPPGSMTEHQDASVNTYRMSVASEQLSSSGATGTRTATITGSKNNAGSMVAISGKLLSSLLHKYATL